MDERTIEAIWRACGAEAPLRIGVTPPNPGVVRTLPYPFAVIGRDPRCEIVLDDELVSRRHALLIVLEGRTYGIDLGSREGVFWGDTARSHGLLEGSATMQVGPYQIQVLRPMAVLAGSGSGEPINPMATWPRGRRHATDLILEVLNPHSRKIRWRIKSFVTMVGRSPFCKVKLMDASVSSVHCCLICTPMGLWVIDLLGRDGIEVNERPVRFARLADSDDLRVGRFQFRVRGELSLPGHSAAESSTNIEANTWRGGPESSSDVFGGASLPALSGPSSRSLELSAKGPESADSVLVPVVNALRMLQQHDQDQHHQTMMMLQTIFAMHGEQINAVRSQLDYVLQLLQESRALPMDAALAAKIAEAAGRKELIGPADRSNGTVKRETKPIASDQSSRSHQLPGVKKTDGKSSTTPKQKPRNPSTSPSDASTPKPRPRPQAEPSAEPVTDASHQASAMNGLGKDKEGKEPVDPSVNPEHSLFEDGMHSMIRDRLYEIRRERMTLWQKIIDMVGGS